jgi:hypothetical protein
MEEMSEAMEAAAFHGIASNGYFPCADRLAYALKALDYYSERANETTDIDALSQKITDLFHNTAPPFLFPDGKDTILSGTVSIPTHDALYVVWRTARDEVLILINDEGHRYAQQQPHRL